MGGGTPSGSAPHPHMPNTSDVVVGQGGGPGAAAVEVVNTLL